MTFKTTQTSDCILWPNAVLPSGYGVRSFQGKTHRAHRVAFYQHHGYWPEVCRHTCDVKLCVNPDHLIDGTVADNNRDKAERGLSGLLNPGMPHFRTDKAEYNREMYRRKQAGTWNYREKANA